VVTDEKSPYQRRRGVTQRARPDIEVIVADGMRDARRRLLESAAAKGQEELES
jgi:hypothetical protein